MIRSAIATVALSLGVGCAPASPDAASAYFDNTGRTDVYAGGIRRIPISTPKGEFTVWTKRVGNNPTIKLLLLHGGPGMTHEYFEPADMYLPAAGIEYYYYDQLGSFYSDQPSDTSLWNVPRFVDEVEQVRAALGLTPDTFYLLGHSWGGMLAMEYALAHQDRLKGLIISNMMASIPAYNEYARNTLMPAMDQTVLAEAQALEAKGDYANPRYLELLIPAHYEQHVLRRPFADWPDPMIRTMNHVNPEIYVRMQGPSELGASGTLVDWDRTADLAKITVPTLVIAGRHDTMDPKHMAWMASTLPNGRLLELPQAGHMAMFDDQAAYFAGVIQFLKDVDRAGR
ncbi:MAG: proline iminopeptidase-family hydrolase [Gemmatimonadales bacterium]